MATKPMSEMTDDELCDARDIVIRDSADFDSKSMSLERMTIDHIAVVQCLILANQYDAELTRRKEGET